MNEPPLYQPDDTDLTLEQYVKIVADAAVEPEGKQVKK